MPKLGLMISIVIFSMLLSVTSVVKNKTRVIEKNTYKIKKKISNIEKDLHETELDFSYLSSPNNLSEKIRELAYIEYAPIDFSRIYLDYNNFLYLENTISTLTKNNEKTKK